MIAVFLKPAGHNGGFSGNGATVAVMLVLHISTLLSRHSRDPLRPTHHSRNWIRKAYAVRAKLDVLHSKVTLLSGDGVFLEVLEVPAQFRTIT